jgi:hypothetical protein
MAGMRALGRVYDVVPSPSGVDICLKDASGVGFIASNGTATAAILTVVAKPSFAGSAKNWTAANGFGLPSTVYTRTANTAAWVANAVAASSGWVNNVLTIPLTTTALISYVDFMVSELADTYDYINVTVSGSGATLVAAVLYDLTVQRTPQNLRIPSA